MALIECTECKRSISDRAAACPHCGAPLGALERRVVTTQATGKGPKLVQLAGFALIVVGVISCVGPGPGKYDIHSGVVLSLLGVCLWFGGRVAAWWRHG